jgi:hypothetical protein
LSAVKDGKEVFSKEEMSESELEDTVGKEIAKKIVAGEGKPIAELETVDRWEPENRPELGGKGVDFEATQVRSLTGLDLKVGGEGMKTFYDTIVPTAVKKLLPKVGGGKIETVGIQVPPTSAMYPDRTTLRETSDQPGFDARRAASKDEPAGSNGSCYPRSCCTDHHITGREDVRSKDLGGNLSEVLQHLPAKRSEQVQLPERSWQEKGCHDGRCRSPG